jgi:glucosamine--fructose-6-phosphate aminotransferase (isomerizing)
VLESQERYIEDLAHSFGDTQDFIYLGRGINFPIALEGALKLKEISYIHAEGYPAGEMKHGPIALLDAKVPVVAIAMPGSRLRQGAFQRPGSQGTGCSANWRRPPRR